MANDYKLKATPLRRLTNLESAFGCKRLYVKNESANPYGTIKDRRNVTVLHEALRLRADKLVLITSGNNGFSLAQFAKADGIKVVCVVNKKMLPATKENLREVAYQVIELNLDHRILRPEELIAFAREKEDEVIWDVTNGYEDTYGEVVREILSEVKPTHIVVPVGSGGIYIGIVHALATKKTPITVIGIGTQNANDSIADKLSTPWTPYAKALEHWQTKHPIYRLSEQEIKRTYGAYRHLLSCEPSSSVVFAAAEHHKFTKKDIVILINSGKSVIR